jgi:acyl-CoA thioester hydrolase
MATVYTSGSADAGRRSVGSRPMRLSLTPPTDPAAYPFSQPIRVRFAETDAMGIAHHASYLPYLEEARVAYLRHLDRPYTRIRDEDGIDFTVIEAYAKYEVPLRFDDVVDVHVLVGKVTRTTFQLGYLLTVDGQRRATAVTVHGCVTADGRPARLPSWIEPTPNT